MNSSDVRNAFNPIDLNKSLQYLEGFGFSDLYTVVQDFVQLSENEMGNYKYPDYVSSIRKEIIDSYNGKNSDRYKRFNTILTAISLIKSCAQINTAIYDLINECKEQENNFGTFHSYSPIYWFDSTNEGVLRIKKAAISTRDKIHGYSKKYTVDGFEENFINKIKYQVYVINDKFLVDTRTVGQKTQDFGIEVFGRVILYGLFFLLFFIVAKCVTSQ